jgi:hypothetical protein
MREIVSTWVLHLSSKHYLSDCTAAADIQSHGMNGGTRPHSLFKALHNAAFGGP